MHLPLGDTSGSSPWGPLGVPLWGPLRGPQGLPISSRAARRQQQQKVQRNIRLFGSGFPDIEALDVGPPDIGAHDMGTPPAGAPVVGAPSGVLYPLDISIALRKQKKEGKGNLLNDKEKLKKMESPHFGKREKNQSGPFQKVKCCC